MSNTKENILIKQEIIDIILHDLKNNGEIAMYLYEHFFLKPKGYIEVDASDEIKILGYAPISCKETCKKFKEFQPQSFLF